MFEQTAQPGFHYNLHKFPTLPLKKSTNSDLNYLGQPYPPSRPSNKRRFLQDERDLPRLCWRDRLATSSRPDPITQLLLYMSPVLHHDLFSCPCWFCSPSRPSITKIFTRRERGIHYIKIMIKELLRCLKDHRSYSNYLSYHILPYKVH